MWFALSLLAAVSKSASQILTKKLHALGTLELAAYSHIFSAVLILPLFFFIEIPLTGAFLYPTACSTVMNVMAILLLIQAIKISDLSHSMPFLSLTPMFAILVAFVSRNEVISPLSASGILFIVLGAFVIDARSLSDLARFGGARIFKDKGVLLVLVVALIYSVSSVCDKSATLASSPLAYVWLFTLARAAIFGLLLAISRVKHGAKKSLAFERENLFVLILIGLVYFLEASFQMQAFEYGNVAETVGVKRVGILFTSISGFMIFKESFTRYKLIGAMLLVLGAVVIYVFR